MVIQSGDQTLFSVSYQNCLLCDRKTKDHLKKDCRMRERQGGVERGGMWSRRRHATRGLDRQCDGPIRLLAQRAVMMMMTMMTLS